ncbi:MAG: hypothetical protein IJV89_01595 [Lentisphaeria bacterium]|nr:hypothetical protein [Lentisphaeria bacterium]
MFSCTVKSILFSCAALVLAGCSVIENSHRQKEPMMADYIVGKNAGVEAFVAEKLDPESWGNVVGSGDEIMWRLESGSIHFHLGKFKESAEQFRLAEELIASYDERAVVSLRDAGSEAGAAVTNMNALPYRGFCRDRIALCIYKSLAYLGEGRESAFRAQLRRLRNEQKKIQADYAAFFEAEQAELQKARKENEAVAKEKNPDRTPEQLAAEPQNAVWAAELKNINETAHRGYAEFLNPAAIFLSGLGSLWDGRYDNARIDFKRLYEAMPQNPMTRQYYVTGLRMADRPVPAELQGVPAFDFPLERNCVYVLLANGRGAAFRQIGIHFPVMTAWPVCEFYPAAFQKLKVSSGRKVYESMLLADMDGIIAREFQERLPGMITRIILSTAIKEAAYYAALAAAREISDSSVRAIAMISVAALGTAYRAAVNTADTRSWELLPKEFQLTQLPMPGNRCVSLTLEGMQTQKWEVQIPVRAESAIIFVSAVNEKNIRYHVFPLGGK